MHSPHPALKYDRRAGVVLVTALALGSASALTLDEIQFWAGAGTNRAALVIHWSAPEARNQTTVPNPLVEQSLAWGYRWDGIAGTEDMFNAILAADPRLFAVVNGNPASGKTVLALGYDLNNNRLFGLRNGTNILAASSLTNAPSAFTNGLAIVGQHEADTFQSLDATDLYWGGANGPNWELWRERGGLGGFINAPRRGADPYWTPDDPAAPATGNHGEWRYVEAGMSGLPLSDGSWMGWTIAAGGRDSGNPGSPGALAWRAHKCAPAAPAAASGGSSPYASEVVAAQPPFGPNPYNDPLSVLGEPVSLGLNFDPIAGSAPFHVKLVEAGYNRDIDGQKVMLTLNRKSSGGGYDYGSVTVRFDHPIKDDPANPYGVDFAVFGNANYPGSGYASDTADMRACSLIGGVLAEPMRISVSPDGVKWHTYTNGPFCDTPFPTHGYEWDAAQHDATGNGWTKKRMDFTKPVNPALDTLLGSPGANLPASEAIQLYAGSGGGTGFDLAETGFESIQYIRVDAAAGYYAGEVDAFSDVRPMVLGDSLTITPGNIDHGAARLCFQKPGVESENFLALSFASVSGIARVDTAALTDLTGFALVPGAVQTAVQTGLEPLAGTTPVDMSADMALAVGSNYAGDGSDLLVLQASGTNWNSLPFTYASETWQVRVAGLTHLSAFVVVRLAAPDLRLTAHGAGYDIRFTPIPGLLHTLERSTNLVNWIPLDSFTASNLSPASLTDNPAPAGKAFYRLRLNRP